TVSVLFGKGNLTFNTPLTLLADMGPNAAVLADFNNDGLVDIATPNRDAGDVAVFINNGNRTFQQAILYGAGFSPSEIISADLNGDLKRDIFVINSYLDASILFNTTP